MTLKHVVVVDRQVNTAPPNSRRPPRVFVQGKIDTLSCRLDTTARENVAVTQELEDTRKQRDDALTKAKTTADNSRKQRKNLKALRTLSADSNAKFSVTKDMLQRTEGKLVVQTESRAKAEKDLHSKDGQLEKATTENRRLTEFAGVLEGKLAVAQDEAVVKGVQLDEEKAKNVVLADRLAEATKLGSVANNEHDQQRRVNDVLRQHLAACIAELAATRKKVMAKDAVIVAQDSKRNQRLHLVSMDQGKTNDMLRLQLDDTIAELQVSEAVTASSKQALLIRRYCCIWYTVAYDKPQGRERKGRRKERTVAQCGVRGNGGFRQNSCSLTTDRLA